MLEPPTDLPPRFRRWAIAVAVVLIVIAIAVAVWWTVRGPDLEPGINALLGG